MKKLKFSVVLSLVLLQGCFKVEREDFSPTIFPNPEAISMHDFSDTLTHFHEVGSIHNDTLIYLNGLLIEMKSAFSNKEYSYDSNGYLTEIHVNNDYPFHHLFYYHFRNDTIHIEFEKLDFEGKVKSRAPYGYYLVDSGLITEEVNFESGDNIQYYYDEKSRLVEKLYRFRSREVARKISYRYIDNSQSLESILDEYGQDTLELRRYKSGILDQIDSDGLEIAYKRLRK